ncbi:M23 family metallopeptidase [Sorangium sp. So ce1078]|uniref:M23 family metallopeptidase n=1 Tax=Sorangium sp. So ce1078 TaxID=3133329 RepID=UPI003F6409E6
MPASGSSQARPTRAAVSPSPLVRGAAASALVLALGGLDDPAPPPPAVVPPAAAARGAAGAAALCGPRTVPEGAACIPLPAPGAPLPEGGAAALSGPAGARPAGAGARGQAYEHIPRRPERPASAAAYAFPVGAPDQPPGFLLVEGAPAQPGALPQASPVAAIGAARPEPPSWAGGVEIAAARGEQVASLRLEGQEGKAEVVFVGELSGITVATAHDVREARDVDRVRRYVILHGHLDRPGPGVVAGARLDAGDVVGYAGDTGSAGLVRLHLEARQLREGARLSDLDPKRITDAAVTVPCDLRNVLPLRQGASL